MKITVLGDPILDHNLYRGLRATTDSSQKLGTRFVTKPGGALLLYDLLENVLKMGDGESCGLAHDCAVSFGLAVDAFVLPAHYHAYAVWEPQEADLTEKDEKKKHDVWRAASPPPGYGPANDGGTLPDFSTAVTKGTDVLVLDDAGLSFRSHPLPGTAPAWTILKLTGSIGSNPLWDSITKAAPENLVVIVSADQLRQSDIRLSQGLSWEATIQDLLLELATNPALAPLKLARHLIVSFRSSAAFWLHRPAKGPASALLVFDGARSEGEWGAQTGNGLVFGYLSCFTAAIVHHLCGTLSQAADKSHPDLDLEPAIVAGLCASRQLHRLGHGKVLAPDPIEPGFPHAEIASAIKTGASNPEKFASIRLDPSAVKSPDWMMLDEWHLRSADASLRRPYHDAAFAAAILGPGALERFPVARFGALRTVDRGEIEGLRIIRQAMQQYRDAGPQKKPLNLGVFGPPGAGKSFGVGEIVKAVFKTDKMLVFNLSQFSDPAMLIGAFHQIRDQVIAGDTPVVFWDEFDSRSLEWLQYLLAPMNDGVFQEGAITHPIGKCVFIFAGATSHSFATFGPPNPTDEDHPDHAALGGMTGDPLHRAHKAWREFVLKKAPTSNPASSPPLMSSAPTPGKPAPSIQRLATTPTAPMSPTAAGPSAAPSSFAPSSSSKKPPASI
jgi:hypothetical protein